MVTGTHDTFMEYMVKKDATVASQLKKCGILLAGLLLAGAGVMMLGSQYLNMLGAALIVCTGWVVYLLLRLQNVEYEYIVTNGEMDVDKIEGKSKRKRLVTIELSSVTEFAPIDPERPAQVGNRVKIFAARNMKSKETYAAFLTHKELGECVLYFTPNEEICELMERGRRKKSVYVPSMGQ